MSGLSGSLLSASQAAASMPSTKRLGSYPGLETSASTPPVAGSIATSAPRNLPKAFSATSCSLMSSVSARLLPEVGGDDASVRMPRPLASISTCPSR